MGLTYYERSTGKQRIKRRYVWAMWSFVVGALLGLVVAAALH